jgi:cytochrome P450 family 6
MNKFQFETSSTVTCFTLHSLAFHDEIQEKARQTIRNVLKKYDNEWCYESVMEMNYLDQIIDESMRLNPPVATLHRELICDYKLSNGSTLPKGLKVTIPVLGFHRDCDIFPEPLKFNPDRFSQEEKQKRHAFSFIPFGEGENF